MIFADRGIAVSGRQLTPLFLRVKECCLIPTFYMHKSSLLFEFC